MVEAGLVMVNLTFLCIADYVVPNSMILPFKYTQYGL